MLFFIRHEGASFILVKDLKNARRCSYLGELDSAEESDEISEEFEFDHDIKEVYHHQQNRNYSNTRPLARVPVNNQRSAHQLHFHFCNRNRTLVVFMVRKSYLDW